MVALNMQEHQPVIKQLYELIRPSKPKNIKIMHEILKL